MALMAWKKDAHKFDGNSSCHSEEKIRGCWICKRLYMTKNLLGTCMLIHMGSAMWATVGMYKRIHTYQTLGNEPRCLSESSIHDLKSCLFVLI